ncbi:MAG TPA: hypothetical protein VJB59_02885 [Bdellovibrionota bacterium]|nr:hypothetical protein [Bdellovibrionota bacterium]
MQRFMLALLAGLSVSLPGAIAGTAEEKETSSIPSASQSWENAEVCTTEQGMGFRRGTPAFNACIEARRKAQQQAGVATFEHGRDTPKDDVSGPFKDPTSQGY